MSKVICDVCGTAFPETAVKCPICGSAKASGKQTAAAQTAGPAVAETSGYTYVKGGRFSKRNVRRRNKAGSSAEKRVAAVERQSAQVPRNQEPEEEKANKGLVAIIVLLLLAIIAVVIYIAVRLFFPGTSGPDKTDPPKTNPPTTIATQPTDSSSVPTIPCTGITLSGKTVTLSEVNGAYTLTVQCAPENTTDSVTFQSMNDKIATVDSTGKIVAVAPGETVIKVTCGAITEECRVVCNFTIPIVPPTDPTTPPTTPPTQPEFVFEFNTKYTDSSSGLSDCTLSKAGQKWKAYKSTLTVPVEDITWISDDPKVCTIENGVVTAVAEGWTRVHAVYNGKTFSCIVRCDF